MGQQAIRHPEYDRGYHDGYNAGMTDGLAGATDVVKKSLAPVVLTAPDVVVAAAKRDLAEKVLAVIPEVGVTWDNDGYESWMGAPGYKDSVVAAIKQVFADSGIELTTTQQQEG
jgi:hypothetical protein